MATAKILSNDNLHKMINLLMSIKSESAEQIEKCISVWTADTTYKKDSVVLVLEGNQYSEYCCDTTHISKATFEEDKTYWTLVSCVEFEGYTEEELLDMLNLSETELQNLQSILQPDVVSTTSTWDSSKIYAELLTVLSESKKFTIAEVAKIVSFSYKVVTSEDDVIDDKAIYLIENTSGTHDMYLLIDGSPSKVGNTSIDLSDYLKKENIVDTFDETTIYTDSDKVFSTKATKEALDTKLNKSAIVTTLDDTVTDEQIPSAKVVHDKLSAKLENNGFDRVLFKELSNGYKTQIVELEDLIVIDYYLAENFNADATRISIHHSGNIDVTKYYKEGENYRSITKKVCMTSVEDVPVTQITSFLDTNITPIGNNSCKYCVENGWCHLVLEININAEKLYAWDDVLDTSQNIPKPKMNLGRTKMVLASGVGDTIIVSSENGTLCMFGSAKVGQYFGSISYPVASDWRP